MPPQSSLEGLFIRPDVMDGAQPNTQTSSEDVEAHAADPNPLPVATPSLHPVPTVPRPSTPSSRSSASDIARSENAVAAKSDAAPRRSSQVDIEAASSKRVAARLSNSPSRFRRFRKGLRGFGRVLYDILVVFWILFVFVIPGGILLAIASVLAVVPNLAILAADGAVALIIGNAILKAAHLSHYTDPASAATIGATGIVLAIFCVGAVTFWLPTNEKGKPAWYITVCTVTLLMTLSGTIGSSLLLRHHVNIGDTDVLHATRALGGVILAPAMALVGPVIIVALGILLTPLWVAMSMGFRWVYGRSSETWNGRMHSSSYCYTYGTCGDDPEIDEEIEELEARRFQPSSYQSHYGMHVDSLWP